MTTTPDEDELEARARLLELGVSYAPTPDDRPAREPEEEGHLEHAVPAEEEEPAAPGPRPGADRLPDWRDPNKPDLSLDKEEPDAEPLVPTSAVDEDAKEPDEEDLEPAEDQEPEDPDAGDSAARPSLRDRLRTWVESVEARENSEPDEEDADDEGGEDEPSKEDQEPDTGDSAWTGLHDRLRALVGPGQERAGRGPGTAGRRRARRSGPSRSKLRRTRADRRRTVVQQPRRRPAFAAPGIPYTLKPKAERRALLEVIQSTPAHVKWLTYNGSAFGVGLYLGWPQWVRDAVAFLVVEHPTLQDSYAMTCYGLAACVLAVDWRARRWPLLLAWAVRIPSSSLVIGVPMYGDPTPLAQLF